MQTVDLNSLIDFHRGEVGTVWNRLDAAREDLREFRSAHRDWRRRTDELGALQQEVRDAKAGLRAQRGLVRDFVQNQTVLRRLISTGFLNLEEVVVDEFQAAGWTWGGEWGDFKDYMHLQTGALGT